MSRAVMRQALEALEYLNVTAEHRVDDRIPDAAITALRAALMEPVTVPEPDHALIAAARAVLDRWHSPAWEWRTQGPTAELMGNLQVALLKYEVGK
jgi:hypothetical protein